MRSGRLLTGAVLILLSVTISGCGESASKKRDAETKKLDEESKKLDTAMVAKLQAQTAQRLKDPSSAQFTMVRLNAEKTAICGNVNAKNGYGGYVGFREFVTTKDGVFIKPDKCSATLVSSLPWEEGSDCGLFMEANRTEKCDTP